MGTAYQCLKLTVCFDTSHAEAYTNIGVLLISTTKNQIIESKRGDLDRARSSYQTAMRHGPHLYEPAYNYALLTFKQQEF